MSLKHLLLTSTALLAPMAIYHGARADDVIYNIGSTEISSPDATDPGDSYIVGDTGTADVSVTNSGSMTTDSDVTLGNASTGDGTLNVDGGSAIANRFYIGLYGKGALTATNGATITASGTDEKFYIGYFGTGTGSVQLSGPGTTLSAYDLNVAWTGNGTATLSDGAVATIEQDVTIGKNAYTTGVLTITGEDSSVTSDRLYVGEIGTGTLNVLDGATYVLTGTSKMYIGNTAGSVGTVTVSGSGSSISTGNLNVGWNGKADLTIADQATVTAANDVTIGAYGPSTGHVTVTGTGSSLAADRIYVGDSGTAYLDITDGGSVFTTGTSKVYLGNTSAGEGHVSISGTGSTLTTGELNIGWNDVGTMVVSDGGSASSNAAISVGYNTGSVGTLTVSTGGTVTVGSGAGTLQIAQLAGSAGTVAIGAEFGDPAAAAGTLAVATVSFGAGMGTLVFNHTDTDYDFAPVLSGSGDIDLYAGTTTFTADSSAFAGATEIHGGTLIVGGKLGGTLGVDDGGILGGSGTVGTTSVASGGTISPGLAGEVGTLNVNGNLTLEAGSIYAIDFAGGLADLLTVTGTATITDGTLSLASLDNSISYKTGQTYTILSASSVTGAFDDTVNDSAFLDIYSATVGNTVALTVERNASAFASVANTANQAAVADALDTLDQTGESLSLYNTVLLMDADEARAVYDQLSGDAYAGQHAVLLQNTFALNSVINDRLRSVFAGVGTGPVPVLSYAEEPAADTDGPFAAYDAAETATPADADRFAIWGSGFGSRGSSQGLDGASGTDNATGGLVVGADLMLSDIWRAGLFAGYSLTSVDTDASAADAESYHVGVYAGTELDALSLRTGLSYTWSGIDSSRSVSALGQTLEGSYDAESFNAFSELAYRFDMSGAVFEPFVGLGYTHLRTEGFSETGGSAALTVDDATMDTTYTTLGMRLERGFEIGEITATARGTLGWMYAGGDVDPNSTARFASGDAFTVSNTPIDSSVALVEAGIDFGLGNGATLGIGYAGQFGKNARQNTVNATMRVPF
jgi:outer membrane autotransporter protein